MTCHASAGMSTFRVALLLACGACAALAERDAPTLHDGVSLMQITRHLSREKLQVHKAYEPITLEAPDGSVDNEFGKSVSISADGARVAVGAPEDSEKGLLSGSVYVFDVVTGNVLRKLTLSDGEPYDQFGDSVSMSANGSRVAVGATGDSDQGSFTGSAFVFDVETGGLVAKLTALDRAAGDRFGCSVSISADGARLAVGAHYKNNYVGAAYVFNISTGEQFPKLAKQDGIAYDFVGNSVSISGDGLLAAVGVPGDDAFRGAVHMFDVATGQLLRKLTAPDKAASDRFGQPVSMSFDGSRVAVGAKGDDDKGSTAGSAYVLDVATGDQLVKLTAPDGTSDDYFGRTVSLSSDGERLAVGAYYAEEGIGAAYVFDVGTGSQLLRLHSPSRALLHFGWSISINSNGTRVAVGRFDHPGFAYLFHLLPTPAPTAPTGSSTGSPTASATSSPTTNPTGSPTQAPTGSPTGSPTASATSSPTTNPTGSPTQEPTPAPPQVASATGDPHATNVDGARFDILRSGSHEFLRLPRRANQSRGSAEEEPLLSILAAVERPSDDECHQSYVKQVDVTGGWLNASGPLRFRAIGDSLDGARAIMLFVNGSSVDVPSLSRDSRVHPFLEVVQPSARRASHVSGAIQKVPMLTVKLSFWGATLNIDWMHRAAPNRQSLNHLNFQASGLRRLLDGTGMDIGGILGRDDHSKAASLPDGCTPAGADLRVASRASALERGLQVIAAAL